MRAKQGVLRCKYNNNSILFVKYSYSLPSTYSNNATKCLSAAWDTVHTVTLVLLSRGFLLQITSVYYKNSQQSIDQQNYSGVLELEMISLHQELFIHSPSGYQESSYAWFHGCYSFAYLGSCFNNNSNTIIN